MNEGHALVYHVDICHLFFGMELVKKKEERTYTKE